MYIKEWAVESFYPPRDPTREGPYVRQFTMPNEVEAEEIARRINADSTPATAKVLYRWVSDTWFEKDAELEDAIDKIVERLTTGIAGYLEIAKCLGLGEDNE